MFPGFAELVDFVMVVSGYHHPLAPFAHACLWSFPLDEVWDLSLRCQANQRGPILHLWDEERATMSLRRIQNAIEDRWNRMGPRL